MLLLSCLLAGAPARAQAASDYTSLSLEDLLTVEITSVAKKRQRVSDAAAAVTVISQEDIRRSGATTLTEALRTVPGLEVAQIDASSTALTVRGFNTRFANTLLVMVDGRSVYVSPLSGVLWDQQMIPLSDVERIEVVRGPGATLWGSNAVNGVINIITKHSIDTLGLAAQATVGTEELSGTLRYGVRLGENSSMRAYITASDRQSLETAGGERYNDGWRGVQAGFRLDSEPNDRDAFTLQGDIQTGDFEYTQTRLIVTPGGANSILETFDGDFEGANILGRWSRRVSETLDWNVQLYFDHVKRRDLEFTLSRDLLDIDATLRWQTSPRNELVIGFNARAAWDEAAGTGSFVSDIDPSNDDQWVSAFIQDDLWLIEDALRLSLGSKFEYNSISGTAIQPSGRLLWHASEALTLWGAASRAVRTPARFETSATLDLGTIPPGVPPNATPLPLSLRVTGSEDFDAEETWAFEAGLRARLSEGWSVDVAGYRNLYDKLRSYTPTAITPIGFPPRGLRLDYTVANDGEGDAWGLEASLSGTLTEFWTLRAGYSFIDLNIDEELSPLSVPIELQNPGLTPRHQASLTSHLDLSDRIEIDTTLRYVADLPAGPVPSYFDLDLRIGWRFSTWGELAIDGQNLLEKRRLEFIQPFYPAPAGYVPRSVSLTLKGRF